jgi:hypothetical protein
VYHLAFPKDIEMSPAHKRTSVVLDVTDEQMRDQEVLRANKELTAYFKGHRTEREARAALKIIKAFIRDRERRDPATRRPLPKADIFKARRKGSAPVTVPKAKNRRKRAHRAAGQASNRPVPFETASTRLHTTESTDTES